MEAEDAALRAYYERGMERERLSDGRGDLEFTRTTEIVLRRLPAAPAVVADIGGGPGRYALWLASLGYQVEHRDLMPLHVEQLTADAVEVPGIHTAVGDVRDLDLPDASVDAVLLLGPLYHLTDRAERVRALRECARIVRPGVGTAMITARAVPARYRPISACRKLPRSPSPLTLPAPWRWGEDRLAARIHGRRAVKPRCRGSETGGA